MSGIDRSTFEEIVNLLLPHMNNESSRQALITSAFVGVTNPPDIDWAGSPRQFTVLLIEKLVAYGEVAPGRHALTMLLEELRHNVGVDIQHQIDDLTNRIQKFSVQPSDSVIKLSDGDLVPQTAPKPLKSAKPFVAEGLYSTLLPVVKMPRYIYAAPSKYHDQQIREAKQEVVFPRQGDMTPFIIHGGMLYCFSNLRYGGNPFRNLIDGDKSQVRRYEAIDWWDDPDYERWFVELLNRSLNKLTGRKGLNWDREHRRYYFQPEAAGEIVEVSYTPLNQSSTKRQVVWQPITRQTGETKNYCYHLAVSLRFHRVSSKRWCLSIRPEMHVTKDGVEPYPSEKVGRRITRKKSRTYNYDLLKDIQFWRDFLSDGQPRILFPFGQHQYIEVSTSMMEAQIEWPGMPEEHAKPFKNVHFPETLDSWAIIHQLEMGDDEITDDWEDFDDDDEWEETGDEDDGDDEAQVDD